MSGPYLSVICDEMGARRKNIPWAAFAAVAAEVLHSRTLAAELGPVRIEYINFS